MNEKTRTIEELVMAKVKSNEITMKPRWFFVLGSLLTIIGTAGIFLAVVFLVNLILFLLRTHGPNWEWRLQIMLSSFPMWVPILAITGLIAGVWMLRKFDFSYKKNFLLIITGFIASILVTAFLLDAFGFNELWLRRGPMRGLYKQIEGNIQMQRGFRGGRYRSTGN